MTRGSVDETPRRAKILFVCEGNVCRSPLAERVLRAMLADAPGDLIICSAGTKASPGMSMDRPTSRLVGELGGDPAGHRSRQVGVEDVRDSGLVLAATRDQRSALARLNPEALDRIFTIRQFGYLLGVASATRQCLDDVDSVPSSRLDLAVESVRQVVYRSSEVPEPDVIDPYGRHESIHARAALQILPTLNQMARFLGGAVRPAPPRLAKSAQRTRWPWRRRR